MISASAKPVSEARARAVAESFSMSGRETRSESMRATLALKGLSSMAPKVYNQPALYVYNLQGGGFVVVAGDDIARPILAYSEVGEVDPENMSECMGDWLDHYTRIIYDLSQKNLAPTTKTDEEWALLSEGGKPERGTDVVLPTAAWDQSKPYNLKCPIISGIQTVTGCVNTACAIIMKYYQHPDHGIGSVGGYSYSFGWAGVSYDISIESYRLGHSYDWAQMPDQYRSGSYTDYQADQISQLMKDLGHANHTFYEIRPNGSSESGADMNFGASNLIHKFDFDKSMAVYEHASVSEELWHRVIRDEIDNKRLVLIQGSPEPGNGPSHAFIVCGYSGDYYCFNMGWGGGSSTFALMSPIDGYDDQLIKYYRYQRIYTNLQPNVGGQEPTVSDCYISKLSISNWSYQTEGFFSFFGSPTFTSVPANATGGGIEYAYGLVSEDERIKEILSVEKGIIAGYSITTSCNICRYPSNYELSDYIAICIRRPGDSEWRVAEHAPGAILPMRYDGRIEDAVSIQAYTKNGTKNIILDFPNSIAVEMKRDDGFMDGSWYAYRFWEADGTIKRSRNDESMVNLDNVAFHLTTRKTGRWEVKFYDSENSYTISIVL